jgi:hypothetical protein
MHSLSNTHGGMLEPEQVKHAAVGGCYSTLKHCREPQVFGEYSFQICICHWMREPLSGRVVGGSPCSSEADSPLCVGYRQLGALVQSEEGKSGNIDRIQRC